MKKLYLASLILLILPVVQAVQIDIYNLEATIEDNIVAEKIEVFVNHTEEESITLLLPPNIKNLETSINGELVECTELEIVGATEVVCPVSVSNNYFMDIAFETNYPLVSLAEKSLFNQDINLVDSVGEFTFKLKLPERAVLPEGPAKVLSPDPTRIYSDGRRIILSYEAENIDEFDVSVLYEPVQKTNFTALGISAILIVLLATLNLYRKRKKLKSKEKEEKLHLLPHEKGIIKILKKEGSLRQKDIEKRVGFSKAKLSRMLRGLEERGVIKRIPKGNTNLIELIKK